MPNEPRPHSDAYLDDTRDSFWNADFLSLMARRWRLENVRSVLDVGCGLGHWLSALAPHLPSGAELHGIDRESTWIEKAPHVLLRRVPSLTPEHLYFKVGDALALPYGGATFDFVTCQTVLMHLAQPETAITEMLRVLKPGGLLACIEPNNFFNYIRTDSLTSQDALENRSAEFRMWSYYQVGKLRLGEGFNGIGDLLPGMFALAGLQDIRVHLSDKAYPIIPPYSEIEQRGWIEQLRRWRATGTGPFDREEVTRYLVAGGATPDFVKDAWHRHCANSDRQLTAIADKVYHAAGGGMLYLVSGRKSR